MRSVDRQNILRVEFVDDQYARQFADRLLAARVITGFGVLAFVMAGAGIFGLMTFLVASRTREIGIRLALGANAWQIRRLVVGSSIGLVLVGAALGILGALGASRWLQSQVYGVSATDPASLLLVTAVVALTAVAASWLPARQAMRVDPTALLKD